MVAPRMMESEAGGTATGCVAMVEASTPTAFDVAIAAMVVAIGSVGSTLSATPWITQASKSSRRGVGCRVFAFASMLSRACQTANGAVEGDIARRMIHAAQNLDSPAGGLKCLPWFRARDIGE
jgi:hypothetical protein